MIVELNSIGKKANIFSQEEWRKVYEGSGVATVVIGGKHGMTDLIGFLRFWEVLVFLSFASSY